MHKRFAQKRLKSTQKEQRMPHNARRTPKCSREHSIPTFLIHLEPFRVKTFGNRVKISTVMGQSTILDCKIVSQTRFWIAPTGSKYQLWIDVPCSFGLYSGYLKRFCIVCPPVISEFCAKIQSLAWLSCRRVERESTLDDLVQARETRASPGDHLLSKVSD